VFTIRTGSAESNYISPEAAWELVLTTYKNRYALIEAQVESSDHIHIAVFVFLVHLHIQVYDTG
jgi:hypothetical protein